MRYLKKLLVITLIFSMVNQFPVLEIVSLDPLSFYADSYDSVYQEYKNDKQFQMMVQDYGEDYGREFLRNVLKNRWQMILMGGGGNDCYQYVKNIRQTTER